MGNNAYVRAQCNECALMHVGHHAVMLHPVANVYTTFVCGIPSL